jgi:DNA polymerase III gamma/tau subunit
MRDAEGTLNQVLNFLPDTKIKAEDVQALLGLVDIHLVVELADFLIKKDKAGALKFISDNIEKGIDIPEFTGTFIDYLRKLLILKIDSNLISSIMPGETKEVKENAQKQSKEFTEENLKKTLNLLLDADNKSKYASIQQLPLELAVIESIGIE